MVTALPAPKTELYYPLNKYSAQLQNWSCKKMTCLCAPVGIVGLLASVVTRVVEGIFMALANILLTFKYLLVGFPKPHSPPMAAAAPPHPAPLSPNPVPLPAAQPPLRIPPPAPILPPPPPTLFYQPTNSLPPAPPLLSTQPVPLPPSELPQPPTLRSTSVVAQPMPLTFAPPAPSQPLQVSPQFADRALAVITREYGAVLRDRVSQGVTELGKHKKTSAAVAVVTGVAAAGAAWTAPILVPAAAGFAAAGWVWKKVRG